jgi:hypothetical protein
MRLRGFLLAGSFALLALSTVPTAHAQDTEAQLTSIRDGIQQARFSEAVAAAQALLERTDLSAVERNSALELLAIAQIATRQAANADRTLQLLYSRDPGHRLSDPDASPPVLSAFARAREARPAPVTVRLQHQTPTLTRREPPELTVRITEGDDAVSEVRLSYRLGSESPSRVVMTRRSDGSYVARIPVVGDASRATDVAYQIIALSPSLATLAEVGTGAEPLQLRIPAETAAAPIVATAVERPISSPTEPTTPPPSGGSVVEEWWFWTLIVAVVGAGVATGIILGPGQEGPERGSLGSVRLMSIELP